MSEIEKFNKINYSKTAKILCVLFVLSVASIVMVYSLFAQGVEDFWSENGGDVVVFDEGYIYDLIDLDAVENTHKQAEPDFDSLVIKYIETSGEVSDFEGRLKN